VRDFSYDIYKDLLSCLQERNTAFATMEEYFDPNFKQDQPIVLLRHDVDRRPKNALEMGSIENALGIKATYYFRTIPGVLDGEIIQELVKLNHEIGYHYECLAETRGDFQRAIADFELNLLKLRKFYPVKSIAMHGRPLSKWDSRSLWQEFDYTKYGILSEPYFDIDFNTVLYITDAGRCWSNAAVNLRDKVTTRFEFKFFHTKDIIQQLREGELPSIIMFNIHPEHWTAGLIKWTKVWLTRMFINFVKRRVLNCFKYLGRLRAGE
jgi:hypothetical protein